MKIKLYLIFFSQILLHSSLALSGPHSGIYSGEFTDAHGDDLISIYVMPDNTAKIILADTQNEVAVLLDNVAVNGSAGTFMDGDQSAQLSGTIQQSSALGLLTANAPFINKNFVATKKSFSGVYLSRAGYYTGTFYTASGAPECGGVYFNGLTEAMIAPDGELHLFLTITSSNIPEYIDSVDFGKFQLVGSLGTFTGSTSADFILTGSTPNGHSILGTFTIDGCPGQFFLPNKVDTLQNYDADSDGSNDEVDNCPNIHNQNQLNTDGDTQGNACDLDDDNDGLPDDWEISNGTDPLIDDASGDIDGDGHTNLQEHLATLDTDNDGMFDQWEIENGFSPDDSSDCPTWVCKPALTTGWRSTIYN